MRGALTYRDFSSVIPFSALEEFLTTPLTCEAADDAFFRRLEAIEHVAVVAVATKGTLDVGIPVWVLLQPVSAKELADTSVRGLLLWGFEWNELVEVLVQSCGFAVAAIGGMRGAMSAERQWSDKESN